MIFKNYLKTPLIKEINQSLKLCKDCKKFNTRGGNFINYPNISKIDVVFIAQNPGASNYNTNVNPQDIVPFGLNTDNRYHLFFDVFCDLFKKEFKRKPIFYITNIIKCCTKDNKIEDQSMIDNCVKKYLLYELETIKKINNNIRIVALGKVSREMLLLNGIASIIIYHPGYMNRNGPDFVKECAQKLVNKLKDKL